MEWRDACIVSLHEGKGDKCVCGNLRGTSLLSVADMRRNRVLIKRITAGTEYLIGEEQCGFIQGRGCMDQMFDVRQVCEK